jgi:hypothetical protein
MIELTNVYSVNIPELAREVEATADASLASVANNEVANDHGKQEACCFERK